MRTDTNWSYSKLPPASNQTAKCGFIRTQLCPYIYILSMAALPHNSTVEYLQQRGLTKKSKMFITWLSTEKLPTLALDHHCYSKCGSRLSIIRTSGSLLKIIFSPYESVSSETTSPGGLCACYSLKGHLPCAHLTAVTLSGQFFPSILAWVFTAILVGLTTT